MAKRVPVILTNILDRINRERETIVERYGEACREELKLSIGEISKLKYELQTDKKMTELPGNESDQYEWNKLLQEIIPNDSYFSAIWLYAECYIYRRLKSIFEETQWLKDFDYFEYSKQLELSKSLLSISRVMKSVNEFNAVFRTQNEIGDFFCRLLKQDLWGNRNDLSITLGAETEQMESNPLQEIDKFNNDLLIDQTGEVWRCISDSDKENKIVDLICDNSGFELLSDLILCDFMINHKLAKKIRFRVKAIPWFISDVTKKDFYYTLDVLEKSDDSILSDAGRRYKEYLTNGQFELTEPNHFFTSPYEFYKMQKIAPELYSSISEAHLAIFKGDLNYRKLLADVNWDPTTIFRIALNHFLPTNLCTLRTVKADLICGLTPHVFEDLWEKDPQWMATGQYGVIQFVSK
jgi:damage-control phosphatase, subfamily III